MLGAMMSLPKRPRRRAILGGLAATALLPADSFRAAGLKVSPRDLDVVRNKAAEMDQLHSLSINVAGESVLAEAFRGPPLSRAVNVKSVSKTLVATLALIAMDKGHLSGPDQKALPLLGALAPKDVDPRAADITVGDLISLRSGLVRTSGPNYGAWVNSRDWIGYILKQPMVSAPGSRMSYSTGDFHIASAVLTNVTGRTTHQLARDWLGKPLGIDFAPWTRDPRGIYMGGNNMSMTPEGMIRFGRMALAGGKFGGTQVVSEARLAEAWRPRGRSPFSGFQYGYGWFLMKAGNVPTYFARGYGGQMIYVMPDLEAVVAITSDASRPARSNGYGGVLNRLLSQDIVPALSQG